MPSMQMELDVFYEDGSSQRVTADQRDVVVFERAMKIGFVRAMDEMTMILFRFIAFEALKRTGQLDTDKYPNRGKWESVCVEVEPVGDEDAQVEDVDPTNPEASPLPSQSVSSKPAGRAKR